MIDELEVNKKPVTPFYIIEETLRNKKEIIQLVPKPLYKVLIMNKKLPWRDKHIKTATIATLSHMLITKYNQTRGKQGDNLITLNASILQKKFGCHYKGYITFLEKSGYIKRHGRYLAGQHSYKYRLTNKFLKSGFKQYSNEDAVTIKKYKTNVLTAIRNKNAISADIIKGLNFNNNDNIPDYIHESIREKLVLDLYNVTIDSDCAMEYVSTIKGRAT